MRDEPRITFHYEVYPDHTEPKGFLPDDKRAQACWFFYTRAQITKEIVGDSIDDQIITDDSEWMDARYESIARTVAMMYGLPSPDEFMKFWPYVIKEAARHGLPIPSESYMRPLRIVGIQ